MILGEPPIGTAELATFVIAQAEKLPGGNVKTIDSKPWTKAIKDGLEELGKSKGFDVLRSDPARRRTEFLLDLLWRLPKPRRDIVLAVECEWDYCQKVLDDFEKLMPIKSPLKLMISSLSKNGKPNNNGVELRKRLENEYLIPFGQHIHDETYLLVNFFGSAPGGWTADAECYQFVAPEDGKIETASFAPLVLAKAATS